MTPIYVFPCLLTLRLRCALLLSINRRRCSPSRRRGDFDRRHAPRQRPQGRPVQFEDPESAPLSARWRSCLVRPRRASHRYLPESHHHDDRRISGAPRHLRQRNLGSAAPKPGRLVLVRGGHSRPHPMAGSFACGLRGGQHQLARHRRRARHRVQHPRVLARPDPR